MPNPTYELNPVNWFKIYEDYREWDVVDNVAKGIEDWEAGQAGAELLAIYVETPSGKESWRYGGSISISFPTGIDDPIAGNAVSSRSYRLKLNEVTLIDVKKYAPTYSLRMSVPYWLPDIRTKIWIYIGPINYPEISLLNTINSKL